MTRTNSMIHSDDLAAYCDIETQCHPNLWIWPKGQLVSEIPLKLVWPSKSGTIREHDVLNVAKVLHHP